MSTNTFAIADSVRGAVYEIRGTDGFLVRIAQDTGEITYGENYEPDEAARVFWDALAAERPKDEQLRNLRTELNRALGFLRDHFQGGHPEEVYITETEVLEVRAFLATVGDTDAG